MTHFLKNKMNNNEENMLKRLIKPLFLLFITTSVSAQGVNVVVDAPGVLKSLLNNSYETNSKLLGGKLNTSLKHYQLSNETKTLYAQNTYVYESDKLKEIIIETDLQKQTPDVQKFAILYDNNGRVKELNYLNKENDSWSLYSKTEYLTDANGFGDTINTYLLKDDQLEKTGIISFVKSEDGKTIESIGSYSTDSTGFIALIKLVYKLDDQGKLKTYESYDYSFVNKDWVHKFDYYFEYNASNNLTVRYLQSFVTGMLFKTEYHYLADGRLDYYELTQKVGDIYIQGSKSIFGYDDKLNLNNFVSQTFEGNEYVEKTKQIYYNDEFGNPLSIEYFYFENGEMKLKEINDFTYSSITSVTDKAEAQSFDLSGNYPNPFNPNTVISFNIRTTGFVELKVFDSLGREIKTLLSQTVSKGNYQIPFDGKDLTSGIYIYQLKSGKSIQTGKMTLLK